MEYWENQVYGVKITIHEVPQKVHVGELEKDGFWCEYGCQPLGSVVSDS